MWLTGPAALRHVGSSQTRARTRVPCISMQILNHCATREALWHLTSLTTSFAFFLSTRNSFLSLPLSQAQTPLLYITQILMFPRSTSQYRFPRRILPSSFVFIPFLCTSVRCSSHICISIHSTSLKAPQRQEPSLVPLCTPLPTSPGS